MSGGEVFSKLARFYSLYGNVPFVAVSGRAFSALCPCKGGKTQGDAELLRPFYEDALRFLERQAAEKGFDTDILDLQRDLYQEFEQRLSSGGNDPRHHFLIVIPVADRPLMLKNCLVSLVEQCHTFKYGGFSPDERDPCYKKVSVFVFDDSKDDANKGNIKEICAATTAAGVRTFYAGIEEQTEVLRNIPPELSRKLARLIGDFDGTVRPHKGASLTRNIAYLHIHSRLREFGSPTLIWFVDSDEEFKIKVNRGGEIMDVRFINYFYWLDRIFAESDVEVLSGKVVGDPPVTPAVMINTFLEDILAFFDRVSGARPDDACVFHSDRSSDPFSAEYHDMTALFGYQKQLSPKKYQCSLTGRHEIRDCFDDFSGRAYGFFSGLHPTRTQFYRHDRDFLKTGPARTVYTGNYVIRRSGLRYFLPFAALGLRMAGPTLGRILRKGLRQGFLSANLPLLHKRTLPERYIDEFRSGIRKEGESVDLSGEFVRQFWGDVMLFSVEEMTDRGYPEHSDEAEIAGTVKNTEERIWELYVHHQTEVGAKVTEIKKHLEDPGRWWNLRPEAKEAVRRFLGFCAVVEKNFGPHSAAWEEISDQIEEGLMKKEIIRAIGSFKEEERLWDEVLKALSGKSASPRPSLP